jgi:hypothetical protein
VGSTARVRAIPALVLTCLALAAAGCGSSSSKHSSSTSPSEAPPSGQSAANETAKPADTILQDAATALGSTHGYELRGVISQRHQRLRLSFTTNGKSSLKLGYATGGAAIQIITLPSSAYLRANRFFWTSHAGPRAATLANRWFQVPVASVHALTAALGPLAPSTVARCLVENHGRLTKAGRTTITGHKAILLKDAGNVPGSSPSLLAVSATGKPYPLRFAATGNQRAGGRVDVCNSGKASQARGQLRFSGFNAVGQIRPPQHAVQLKSGLRST